MRTLDALEMAGKRVFLRVDLNVPLGKDGSVADDTRIGAILPSLTKILAAGGRAVLASHLGRPKGQVKREFSLRPVADHLSRVLGRAVPLASDCIGPGIRAEVERLAAGELILLENLRFHPGEEKNDPEFARELAALADLYVNDAFAVSHRAHASVEGITHHVAICAAGCQLEKELAAYRQALGTPERPLAAIIGGAKVSSKIGVLKNVIPKLDILIIGGAMANTFLKSLGTDVGRSLVEDDLLGTARELLELAATHRVQVVLPIDAVTAPSLAEPQPVRTVAIDRVPADSQVLDLGPESVKRCREALAKAKTIVWNGPLGAFETPPFQAATFALAAWLGELPAFTIIGGGDSASAVNKAGVAAKMGYISTGGGAFLELMEGKILPGVAALEQCGGQL